MLKNFAIFFHDDPKMLQRKQIELNFLRLKTNKKQKTNIAFKIKKLNMAAFNSYFLKKKCIFST